MRKIILFVLFLHFYSAAFSQISHEKPKLIVGIVVDQMRYDMLTRFQHNFSENGLKRLMKKGFFAENMHYNYAPTFTGPGHASIYTGTTPAVHGIAANDWIEHGEKSMYCTEDEIANSVGGDAKAGKMSPNNLKVTTLTDQLRLFTNNQSKVIGIALKDRGAILPVGHSANAAYWYDGKTGNWMTSDYYMNSLPRWVQEFNAKHRPVELMKSNWNLLYQQEKYVYIAQDNMPWEELNFGAIHSKIPYTFHPDKYYSEIRLTPFGNSLTSEIAIATLQNEKLGLGNAMDFLAVSYSSTDYVGHAYGPYSLEAEDTYYRLDKDIEQLLNALDAQVGKDNYWLFMTADHGVQDVPDFAKANKIPAGIVDSKLLTISLNNYLKLKTGASDIISKIMNEQIYLNKKSEVGADDVAKYLNKINYDSIRGIRGFYAFDELIEAPIPNYIKEKLINGYYPHRSGEIAMLLEPNWMIHGKKGTTHGSPYSHDTHVPFLFFGKGVRPESSSTLYHITDIAPTISFLLGMLQPNGCIGKPILELEYLK